MTPQEKVTQLAQTILTELDYPESKARLRRLKFLLAVFELQEQDASAEIFVSGKYNFNYRTRSDQVVVQ